MGADVIIALHGLVLGGPIPERPARKFSNIIMFMYFKSKKTPLLILGVTSIVCSRVFFLFINDPEGPNLLVVMEMAVVVYVLSLAVYLFSPSVKDLKRLLLVIFIQIIIVTGFYFFLK